jgi:hypothetical protein
MDLPPASPAAFECARSAVALDLGTDSIATVRPQAAASVLMSRRVADLRGDEDLVPDDRAGLSPAQSVERKLILLLRGGTIPVSHIRMARLCRHA